MREQEPPKIQFPCQYPIKVVGYAAPDYEQFVLDVIAVHAPDIDLSLTRFRQSSNGKYYSLTVFIIATGEPQLRAIFEDLKASGRVTLVL